MSPWKAFRYSLVSTPRYEVDSNLRNILFDSGKEKLKARMKRARFYTTVYANRFQLYFDFNVYQILPANHRFQPLFRKLADKRQESVNLLRKLFLDLSEERLQNFKPVLLICKKVNEVIFKRNATSLTA